MNELPEVTAVPKDLKLMIVEDYALVYDNLARFFKHKAFHIVAPPPGKTIIDSYAAALEAMKLEKPQIAVLDIDLNGRKTGLDLGLLLHTKHNIPCVFLTGIADKIDPVTAARISAVPTIAKLHKSVHNEQVLAALRFIWGRHLATHPGITPCNVYFVKIDPKYYHKITREDPELYRLNINWSDVKFLSSFNAKFGEGNNQVLIHPINKGDGYLLHGTLSEWEGRLPDQFIRLSRDIIINMDSVVQYEALEHRVVMNGVDFIFTEVFRSRNFNRFIEYFKRRKDPD